MSATVDEPAFARPRLGVVMPLLNEAEVLDETFERLGAQLLPGDLHFCVVDGGSTDDTRERVAARAEQDPRVRLVWVPENDNVVGAYLAGFGAALDADCGWILEMDGGLSHLPEQIPRFLAAMGRGVDFAPSTRFAHGGVYAAPFPRWFFSRGGSVLANVFLGTKLSDMTSGFECFSAAALRHLLSVGLRSRSGFVQSEIRYTLRDWNLEEVPISYTSDLRRPHRGSVGETFRMIALLRREAKRGTPA